MAYAVVRAFWMCPLRRIPRIAELCVRDLTPGGMKRRKLAITVYEKYGAMDGC